jgi:N-formylglutamate deformylase
MQLPSAPAKMTPPCLEIVRPRGPAIALVCDSPHSGTQYPPDFGYHVDLADLRRCEDTLVEALWAAVSEVGGTLIHAHFPRSYIDVNRTCTDIDTAMLADPWPGQVEVSEPCTRLGNGLVFRKTTTMADIYDRKLTAAEVQRRIDTCWRPYRQAVADSLDQAMAPAGRAWHLNLHSMPSNAYERLGRVSATPLADVVLGDLRGRSCSAAFADCVAAAFRAQGYRVAMNDPYAGQDLVRQHGRPTEGCESLQIEINRGLYLDEATRQPGANFTRVRDDVSAVLRAVAAFVQSMSADAATQTVHPGASR